MTQHFRSEVMTKVFDPSLVPSVCGDALQAYSSPIKEVSQCENMLAGRLETRLVLFRMRALFMNRSIEPYRRIEFFKQDVLNILSNIKSTSIKTLAL